MRTPASRRIAALSIILLSLVPLSTALVGRPPLILENSYSGEQEVVAHCLQDAFAPVYCPILAGS